MGELEKLKRTKYGPGGQLMYHVRNCISFPYSVFCTGPFRNSLCPMIYYEKLANEISCGNEGITPLNEQSHFLRCKTNSHRNILSVENCMTSYGAISFAEQATSRYYMNGVQGKNS